MASIEDANHIQGPQPTKLRQSGGPSHYTLVENLQSDKKLQAWRDSTQHPTTQY